MLLAIQILLVQPTSIDYTKAFNTACTSQKGNGETELQSMDAHESAA
jgi:hypothetical protein